MTKDQEVSKWFAEQMGHTEYITPDKCSIKQFDINDLACQMAIIKWWGRIEDPYRSYIYDGNYHQFKDAREH